MLYYILACTYGFIMTVSGLVVSCVLYLVKLFVKDKNKIIFKLYNLVYSISIGNDLWGGCDFVLCFLRDYKSSCSLDAHEYGHTFQNCLFGSLFLFLVAGPSATRWWIRYLNKNKNKKFAPYDSIWFEDAATQCGLYANTYFNTKK